MQYERFDFLNLGRDWKYAGIRNVTDTTLVNHAHYARITTVKQVVDRRRCSDPLDHDIYYFYCGAFQIDSRITDCVFHIYDYTHPIVSKDGRYAKSTDS